MAVYVNQYIYIIIYVYIGIHIHAYTCNIHNYKYIDVYVKARFVNLARLKGGRPGLKRADRL